MGKCKCEGLNPGQKSDTEACLWNPNTSRMGGRDKKSLGMHWPASLMYTAADKLLEPEVVLRPLHNMPVFTHTLYV